jgi:hypothetical protein
VEGSSLRCFGLQVRWMDSVSYGYGCEWGCLSCTAYITACKVHDSRHFYSMGLLNRNISTRSLE